MSDEPKQTPDEGEVVYRRMPEPESAPRGDGAGAPARPTSLQKTNIAPSLKPLLVGFVLLLVLIGSLGYFSRRELDNVETGTNFFQNQYTSKVKQLLNLHASAIRLDSEARVRSAGELRNELMPPFELPLGKARGEVEKELALLAQMPFAGDESWRILRERLELFMATTKDMRAFSLQGFPQFRDFESQIGIVESELAREPGEVSRRTEYLRGQSTRRVTFWWVTALLIGLIVIVATVWEVQRRFRHEQESLEEARRERQFSTQMIEGMVSAVAAIDAKAHLRSANSTFIELFPTVTVGASVYDALAATEAQKMLEIAVSKQGEPGGYRGRWPLGANVSSGAGPLTFDLYTSPLEIDGEQGQIITLVDVTEAVESETMLRRSEALAAVGQASAQVAHEIRNPLGSIRLGVSMLRDMTGSKEAITTIDLVERGIDHLNKLVVDVTRFSREKPLEPTEFDLHNLLNSSLELVSDRIRDKQQHIEKNFSAESLKGEWDEDQLRQVFVNLLANAIDASSKNARVDFTVERVTSRSRGAGSIGLGPEVAKIDFARVTIADQGEGIDEVTRTRIFEPFFTTKKRGTGLGLAIVKQIVERHGGTISVHSEPGKGASFVVDLPLHVREFKNVKT